MIIFLNQNDYMTEWSFQHQWRFEIIRNFGYWIIAFTALLKQKSAPYCTKENHVSIFSVKLTLFLLELLTNCHYELKVHVQLYCWILLLARILGNLEMKFVFKGKKERFDVYQAIILWFCETMARNNTIHSWNWSS